MNATIADFLVEEGLPVNADVAMAYARFVYIQGYLEGLRERAANNDEAAA